MCACAHMSVCVCVCISLYACVSCRDGTLAAPLPLLRRSTEFCPPGQFSRVLHIFPISDAQTKFWDWARPRPNFQPHEGPHQTPTKPPPILHQYFSAKVLVEYWWGFGGVLVGSAWGWTFGRGASRGLEIPVDGSKFKFGASEIRKEA